MSTSAAKMTKEEMLRSCACIYLEDRVAELLIGREEPAKTGELTKSLEIEGVTMRLLREILGKSPRFETIERRWTLATRTQDKKRPLDTVVQSIIAGYGRPVPIAALARELVHIFDRPTEYFETLLPRLLASQDKYFAAGRDSWGLSKWLVLPFDTEEEVIFQNFLSEEEIREYEKPAAKANWDSGVAAAASQFAAAAKAPVPLRMMEFFAWRALRPDYDAAAVYREIATSEHVILLSNLTVLPANIKGDLIHIIHEIAEEIEKAAPEGEEEGVEAGPVEVTEADVAEAVEMILASTIPVTADEILESVLEISPADSGYEQAFESLVTALADREEITSVGIGRWRAAGTIPDYTSQIPPELIIPPHTPYETPEGDIYDQELEDEGLEGSLRQEIMDPLVQDVGDEDPDKSLVQPNGDRQRCVVKYHHKAAGTFPLCQINPEFFGTEPEVIQITLIGDGVRRDAWVSNKTRLIYNMGEWYADIQDMPLSGAVFYLERTSRPGEFRFIYEPEPDPLLYVPLNRIMELIELKNQAEATETPVFDIVTRILEQHGKGIRFIPLFTEVNLVRRVTRRLVASILSSYHAFDQVKKTNEWRYDQKKRSQGFNKAKRKYIKK